MAYVNASFQGFPSWLLERLLLKDYQDEYNAQSTNCAQRKTFHPFWFLGSWNYTIAKISDVIRRFWFPAACSAAALGAKIGLLLLLLFLSSFHPILHEGGTLCPSMWIISFAASVDAPNELILHDFVSYNICQVPSRPFLKKNWKIEKNQILLLKNLCKNIEKNEKMFFLQQIMLFQHEFDFYMFLAFFWGTYRMLWSKF